MLILHHRNILSVVSIGSFKDYKLTFATKLWQFLLCHHKNTFHVMYWKNFTQQQVESLIYMVAKISKICIVLILWPGTTAEINAFL